MLRMRTSIGSLMLAVLLVAVNLAAFQVALDKRILIDVSPPGRSGVVYTDLLPFALGVLPMATLLVILAWRTIRTQRCSRFRMGFQTSGWLGLALFVAGSIVWPRGVAIYVRLGVDTVDYAVPRLTGINLNAIPDGLMWTYNFGFGIPIMSAPVFLVALLGSWGFRRLTGTARVTIPGLLRKDPENRDEYKMVPKNHCAAGFA